ncbi:MAG: DUF262 domain-containing protein [Patescibacteria group bacterium]
MSTVQIVGKEYYCKDIFNDGFRFFIPRYQRPYAWTTEHTEELFGDLWMAYSTGDSTVEEKDPYFLGSIVLIKAEHVPRAEVIDGQQRLTTLTILLSAIRHCMPNFADFIADYLRQKGKPLEGLKDEFRLSLRQQDVEFFEKHIQGKDGFADLENLNPASLRNDAQRNIRANALYLRDILKAKPSDQLEGFCKFIVTKCVMVVVSTPDIDSAYRIFSVMNDRGLDLSHSDILKADVIGAIDGDGKQEAYVMKWETVEENLGRQTFDELFAHIRMIHMKQKLRSTILKEIREQVKPNSSPEIFIDKELIPYADALEIVKDNSYVSTNGAENINMYLRWLNRVDNFDWIPPALVAIAKHQNAPEWLEDFFRQLERLAERCEKQIMWKAKKSRKKLGEQSGMNDIVKVAMMLWNENIKSVQDRYNERERSNLPGTIADGQSGYKITPEAFDIRFEIDPVQVLRSIACYEYQSCEHAGWEKSEAKNFCNSLKDKAINTLPGYDIARWGAPEPIA